MKYVAVTDLKVGDVIVNLSKMHARDKGSRHETTITSVGAIQDHGGRKYKHFVGDLNASGHLTPSHKFMLPVLSNVRVK